MPGLVFADSGCAERSCAASPSGACARPQAVLCDAQLFHGNRARSRRSQISSLSFFADGIGRCVQNAQTKARIALVRPNAGGILRAWSGMATIEARRGDGTSAASLRTPEPLL